MGATGLLFNLPNGLPTLHFALLCDQKFKKNPQSQTKYKNHLTKQFKRSRNNKKLVLPLISPCIHTTAHHAIFFICSKMFNWAKSEELKEN